MRLQATHGPTYQHYHEHAHHIDQKNLSEQDPTHLQPYEWVHLPIENSQQQWRNQKQPYHGHQ